MENNVINLEQEKKYMSRHNGVGKVIHWELCKRLKSDHVDK